MMKDTVRGGHFLIMEETVRGGHFLIMQETVRGGHSISKVLWVWEVGWGVYHGLDIN